LRFLPKNIAHKRFAPVFIGDVLRNVGYAFEHAECWNRSYVVCGPEYMEIKEAIDRYHVKTPSIVKVPGVVSRVQLKRAFGKQVFSFYSRYMDLEADALTSKYPPLRFY
jgi:hypothetical protein